MRNLAFTWNVTRFTEYEMEIQVKFEDPVQISSFSDPDILQIIFNGEAIFFDFTG